MLTSKLVKWALFNEMFARIAKKTEKTHKNVQEKRMNNKKTQLSNPR